MKEYIENAEQDMVSLLGEQLLNPLQNYQQKRLKNLAEVIEQMQQRLSSDSAFGAIGDGINLLETFVQDESRLVIDDRILANILSLKNKLPESKTVAQSQQRFKIQPKDELYVKVGKNAKQLLKKLGKDEWQQKVPLANAVAYHLLNATWLFEDWLATEQRLVMQIILELDQALARAAESKSIEGDRAELQQLLEVLHNEIQESVRVRQEKMEEAKNILARNLKNELQKIGTFEQRSGFYSQNRIDRKKEHLKSEMQAYYQKWNALNTSLLKRTQTMYQFAVFCEDLHKQKTAFINELGEVFDRYFLEPYSQIRKKIEAARQKVNHSKNGRSQVLEQQKQTLHKAIRGEVLQPLRQSIEQDEIEQQLTSFFSSLRQQANTLHETTTLLADIDRGYDPPRSKSRTVKWQALVNRQLNKSLLDNITPAEGGIDAFKNEQLQEVQEVESIIEVNLESALELTDEQNPTDDPLAVTDEALNRAQAKIEKLNSEAESLKKRLLNPLDEGVEDFKQEMLALLYKGDVDTFQLLDAQFKVTEKTEGVKSEVDSLLAKIKNRSTVFGRFIVQKTKLYYQKSRVFLGFESAVAPQPTQKADIAAYLSETEQRMGELPYIYRRLFDFKSTPQTRYFVGWTENVNYLQQALNHWKSGFAATLAIAGEKGSGKSAFLDLAENEILANEHVIRINLEQTIWRANELLSLFDSKFEDQEFGSIDALISHLKRQTDGNTIIIFEGMQNLYIRQPGGYEAVEQFTYLLSETSEAIFWVVSCSKYAWSFFNEAFSFSDYFSHYLQTDNLSEQQTRKVIMNRHRTSGYELVFVPSEKDTKNRAYQKLKTDSEQSQTYLRERYFEQLAKLANGNASIAMIFWVRSITEFDDTHLYIAPLEAASLHMLDDLKPETLFILSSLVMHDRLFAEELAIIHRQPLQESRMILRRLKNRGIVIETEFGFSINHLMYRQVVDELKEHNILHI